PHLHRMIDQLIVACRAVETEAKGRRPFAPHRCRHPPASIARPPGRQDLDLACARLFSQRAQEDAGPVEESVRSVQMRTPHRQVPRVNLQRDGESALDWRRCPGVLVELGDRDAAPAALRADRDYVTREVADQVAAGYPSRQGEALALRIGIVHAAAHFKQMSLWTSRDYSVTGPRN